MRKKLAALLAIVVLAVGLFAINNAAHAKPVQASGVTTLYLIDDLGTIYHACVGGITVNGVYVTYCYDTPAGRNWLGDIWATGTRFNVDLYYNDWTFYATAYPWAHTPGAWCFTDLHLLDDGWSC